MQPNGLGVLVGLLVMFALRGMHKNDDNIASSKIDYHYRALLYGTALLLVAATFEIFCVYSWAASIFDNELVSATIKGLAASASFGYGAMFTVIAGFVFLPVAFARKPGASLDTFTDLLAVLAPLVAALPLAKLFS